MPPPCSVSVSTSFTNATCGAADGTATATLIGGSGNLQYSWTGPNGFTSIQGPTISGLAAGTYNVNIVDGNQCAEQATIIVGSAPSVQLSAIISNTTCGGSNGSIDASASSGTPPYSYSLDGGPGQNTGLFSNLSSGTYSLLVTDGAGCTDVQQYTVGDDPDNTPPSIVCPGNITLNNDPGECGVVFGNNIPLPLPIDNCFGTVITTNPAQGSLLPIGTTTINVLATDAAGNTATCSFDVTVNDTEDPVIICPAAISVANDPGDCGALVNFAATATDNCPGVIISYSQASGTFFPVGVTTVDAIATDAAGNTATCSFTVTVNDTETPEISCPADISVCDGAIVTYSMPSASDNCPGVSVSQVDATGLSSGDVFPLGVTTLQYTATDALGNTKSCSFNVTVNPNPTLILSSAAMASTGGGTFGGMDTSIVIGYGAQSLQLNATVSGGSTFTYSWAGNTSALSDPSIENPVFTPTLSA